MISVKEIIELAEKIVKISYISSFIFMLLSVFFVLIIAVNTGILGFLIFISMIFVIIGNAIIYWKVYDVMKNGGEF
jgi:uncharacterized membrane protein (DUF485 family)